MALEEFRRGALSPALRDAASYHIPMMSERQNKYSTHESGEGLMYIICFSSTTKFGAIFSPALIFSFELEAHQPPAEVLSFISREKKERYQEHGTLPIQVTAFGDGCSLSFVHLAFSKIGLAQK